MHADYLNPALRELRDQQVRFAPRDKKIEQVTRAEALLGEIDPQRAYPYHYLCFRITDYRPEAYPDLKVQGAEALHDLRLFVEDVSDAADISAEAAGERVLTVDELSQKYKVSTKTVSRWREQGLVGRRFVFDGRKRVGFLSSSVERFVAANEDRVRRGSKFSQLSEADRQEIVERARRLARVGGCPGDVARRIAERMGRSVETIRYTIRHFDEQHPDLAVFPERMGPLTKEAKSRIYQQHRLGTDVGALARQFCRTRNTIYRVLNEMRAERLKELPLDYIPNPEFQARDAERRILSPVPEHPEAPKRNRPPAGLPPYLASLYEAPLLSREQEQHLFRQMNYQKFRAAALRDKLDPAQAKSSLMDEIDRWYDDSVATKNQLIKANLRLVVSIAKRHVGPDGNFFELVSDGNVSLMRAVEKFDYARGNKFSTYASWAIMKNFARSIPDQHRRQDRFRTSLDELFAATEDGRTDQVELETAQAVREEQVERMLQRLDEREQEIIVNRFGLDHRQEPLTLKEVGARLGVTKERVRQIEARALHKLRQAAVEERVEFETDEGEEG